MTSELKKALDKMNEAIEEVNRLSPDVPDETGKAMLHVYSEGEGLVFTRFGSQRLLAGMLLTIAREDEGIANCMIMATRELISDKKSK